jgi:hypothetical protein
MKFNIIELEEVDSTNKYEAGEDFESEQIKMYTVVTWLEVEDPQSSNEYKSPIGATIKLGVEITAYEN